MKMKKIFALLLGVCMIGGLVALQRGRLYIKRK